MCICYSSLQMVSAQKPLAIKKKGATLCREATQRQVAGNPGAARSYMLGVTLPERCRSLKPPNFSTHPQNGLLSSSG